MFHGTLKAIVIGWMVLGCSGPPPVAHGGDDVENVAQWVSLLESRNFNDRRDAIARLIAADVAAVSPVAEAAEAGEPESLRNCLVVLKRIHAQGSAEGKAAAEEALKTLSQSKLPQVAIAAQTALKPEADPVAPPRRVLQIGVRNVNGKRTITVREPDREIEISDADGKEIRMSVKETVKGQAVTSEYAAADVAELKTKHPEAAAIYEKYGRNNGIQIQMQAFNFPGGGPGRFAGRPIRGPGHAIADEKIESALKSLAEVRDQLKTLPGENKVDPAVTEKLQEALKQAEKELFAAQEALKR